MQKNFKTFEELKVGDKTYYEEVDNLFDFIRNCRPTVEFVYAHYSELKIDTDLFIFEKLPRNKSVYSYTLKRNKNKKICYFGTSEEAVHKQIEKDYQEQMQKLIEKMNQFADSLDKSTDSLDSIKKEIQKLKKINEPRN